MSSTVHLGPYIITYDRFNTIYRRFDLPLLVCGSSSMCMTDEGNVLRNVDDFFIPKEVWI